MVKILELQKTGFTPGAIQPEAPLKPTAGEIFGSAFYLENDVAGIARANSIVENNIPDWEFDISERVKSAPREFELYPEAFYGKVNEGQFQGALSRIREEEKQRNILASGGITGVVAGLSAGILSPVNFIPLIGTGAKGLKAVAQGMASGAVAGGIQSMTLSATQETRGVDEVIFDVTAGAVLGGILGKASSMLTPDELARLEIETTDPIPLLPDPPKGSLEGEVKPKIVPEKTGTVVPETDGTIPTQHPDMNEFIFAAEKNFPGATPSTGLLPYIPPRGYKDIAPNKLSDFLMSKRNQLSSNDVLKWLAENSDNAGYRAIATAFLGKGKAPVYSIKLGDLVPSNYADRTETLGMYLRNSPKPDHSGIIMLPDKTTELTVLHEVIHDLTTIKLTNDPDFRSGVRDLQRRIATFMKDNPDKMGSNKHYLNYATDGVHELLTVTLTDPGVQKFLQQIVIGDKTIWSEFVDLLRRAFKIAPNHYTAFDEVLRLTENLLDKKPTIAKPALLADGGAKAVRDAQATNLKGLLGTSSTAAIRIDRLLGPVSESPVVHNIAQRTFATARSFMLGLSDAGLGLQENAFGRSGAAGGTVENRIKTWYTGLEKSVQAVDFGYRKYYFGKNEPRNAATFQFRDTRATIGGSMTKGKLSKYEFRQEISRAMRAGATYDGIPEAMEAAAEIKKALYDPLTKAAVDIGLLSQEVIDNVIGDVSYLNRVFNTNTIKNNMPKFVEILSKHFVEQMDAKFARELATVKKRIAADEELVRIIDLDEVTVDALKKQYADDLARLDATPAAKASKEIADVKQQIKDVKEKFGGKTSILETIDGYPRVRQFEDEVKALREKETSLRESAGPELDAYAEELKSIKRGQSLINRSAIVLSRQQQATLAQIEKIEDTQLRQLDKFIKEFTWTKKELAKVEPEVLTAKINRFIERAAKMAETLKRGDSRLEKLMKKTKPLPEGTPDDVLEKIIDQTKFQQVNYEKLEKLLTRLRSTEDTLEQADILREMLDDKFDAFKVFTNEINSKRAVRQERLREQAAKLAPERIAETKAGLKASAKKRRQDFTDNMRLRGADDIDFEGGKASFMPQAIQDADEVMDKIIGTTARLPTMEILQAERGPELARMLNIPSEKLEEFLENDIETLSRAYLYTMSADIEMMKKFGTVNGKDQFIDMAREAKALQAAAKGEKERAAIRKEYDKVKLNAEVVIQRMRHSRGIPANPYGASARLAKVAMNINTLRFMGTVLPSSLPDLARPVMKFGLQRVMKDSFGPLITNLKAFKMSAAEARLAGVANDVTIHTRLRQISDVVETYVPTSKFERGLEYATSRIGVVALFDYWTTAMKQFSAVTINAEILDNLSVVIGGNKGLRKQPEAVEFLARVGLTGERASHIWALVQQTEGGGRMNGVWLPNTESWLDPAVMKAAGLGEDQVREALTSYRAALAGEVDNTIITPGVERPNWVDASMGHRLISQFRSFGMSSTQKTLMAGLQQRDMAFFNGTMVSLALGTLSYYIWAVSAGGQAYDEMMTADADKWADEAIQRSGIMGVLGEVQRVGESFKPTQGMVSFSGEVSTRRGGGDLLDAMAGPSFNLAQKLAELGSNAPDRRTVALTRDLVPYQNVFWLRQILDQVEEGTADALGLQEKRK